MARRAAADGGLTLDEAREPLAPGRSLDGFVLEEQIHAGRRTTIWRVSREGMRLPLLMKLPRRGALDEPGPIVGFEIEQMILPRLRGTHVPAFVAAGEVAGQPYLVMERIPGASLAARLGGGALSPEEVAGIGARVATALHDLHRQHVIHHDVAPENVLFRENGVAVLIDFGLSRHDQLPDLMAEVIALPTGTDAYSAPEQAFRVRYDPRSDIFSLGVILYQLVTAQLPFGGDCGPVGPKRRRHAEPDPLLSLNGRCPDWLQEIVLRCLESDPTRRYASAAQLAFALQNPGQVVLTEPAGRGGRAGPLSAMGRWLRRAASGPAAARPVSRHLDAVPIIMVAVDVAAGEDPLAQELRLAVRRIFLSEIGARLTCVAVRPPPPAAVDPGGDDGGDDGGESFPMRHLTGLKNWARPLELPAGRVTFHVLASPDPAAALVDYAKANEVEHIVVGARGGPMTGRSLGGVSGRVATESPCTVTVVRVPDECETSGGPQGLRADREEG